MIYFPTHLQIETVAGLCSADCTMCTIKEISRKGFLSIDKYTKVLNKFANDIDKLDFLTLHGMGEPLLDPTLAVKVGIARNMGFSGIGFATNATHLTLQIGEQLLLNGLNTIIFSLDGIKKETHEKIRRGVDYDQVLSNVLEFISLRNLKGQTKIIVRMIRQNDNKDEWKEYLSFWQNHLNPEFGDQVSAFDIHNWGVRDMPGGKTKSRKTGEVSCQPPIVCPDLISRMIVFITGDVALCCGDEKGAHNLGNIFTESPSVIFNGPVFTAFRKKMLEGKIAEIDYCKNCQIVLSRIGKQYLDVVKNKTV